MNNWKHLHIILTIIIMMFGLVSVFPDSIDSSTIQDMDFETNVSFEEGLAPPLVINQKSKMKRYLLDPLKTTLKHEFGYKISEPSRIQNNRSTARLEYSNLFANAIYTRLDFRVKGFLKEDHRTHPSLYWVNDSKQNVNLGFESRLREGFLQFSFLNTSIKTGILILALGESEAGEITDIVTPRDYNDPFILSLEELRFGQPMLNIDQFTPFGDFSFFFIPYPFFNEQPKRGSAYYIDAFNGYMVHENSNDFEDNFEFGVKWVKTFGRSDINIMGASLINNNHSYKFDIQKNRIEQLDTRIYLTGVTFNYAISNALIKGEMGLKNDIPFNDEYLDIVKRNTLDGSLGMEYAYNPTFSFGIEGVNNFVINWDGKLQGVPENSYTIFFFLNKLLFHNSLSVTWVSMINGAHLSYFNLFTTSWHINDYLSLSLDVTLPFTDDEKSRLYAYRKQQLIASKIELQF